MALQTFKEVENTWKCTCEKGVCVPLQNKIFGELSDQLVQNVHILHPTLEKLSTMWACESLEKITFQTLTLHWNRTCHSGHSSSSKV